MAVCGGFSGLFAGTGLAVRNEPETGGEPVISSIESDISDSDLMFDKKTESSASVRRGRYVGIRLAGPAYLKSLDLIFTDRTVSRKMNLRIGTSLDAVNWTWRSKVIRTGNARQKIFLSTESRLASFVHIVFAGPKDLDCDIAEIELEEAVLPKLVISDVRVRRITEDSAVISWTTPIETTGLIHYGIQKADRVGFDPSYKKNHSVELVELWRGTGYVFDIGASDAVGRKAVFVNAQFATIGTPDPFFESVQVGAVDWSRMRFAAVMNVPSRISLRVREDSQSGYEEELIVESLPGFGRTNRIEIGGLNPETWYFYRVIGQDRRGKAVTNEGSFVTPEKNIAVGRPVTGTFAGKRTDDSSVPEGDVPGFITDGRYDTRAGRAVSGNPAHEDQFFTIDLGEFRAIDRVKFAFGALNYPCDFSLEFSADGTEWETVAGNLDALTGSSSLSESGDPMKVVSVPANGRSARFVKFMMKKGSRRFKQSDSHDFIEVFETAVIPAGG